MLPIPKYSVVIATYNRKSTLLLTLHSVIAQSIPADLFEVLIVDDGSSDGTGDMVSEFQKQNLNRSIKYFHQQNAGPSKARNRGIQESYGEIIFFTDDDCVVPENWIETLLEGYRKYPEAVGVGGWSKPANSELANRYFQKYFTFLEEGILQNTMSIRETKGNIFARGLSDYAGNTANMSYRREIFEKAGWFDENLTFAGGVDWDLKIQVQKQGYYLVYLPFFVGHLKDYTFLTFIKKAFNRGRGYYYISRKYAFLEKNYLYRNSSYFFMARIIVFALSKKKFIFAHTLESTVEFIGSWYMWWHLTSNKMTPKIFPGVTLLEKKTINILSGKVFFTRLLPVIGSEDKKEGVNLNVFSSIVIPTYNRSSSLLNTLNSLIKQSIAPSDFEIVIVDDGSTDDTRAIVSKFKRENRSYSIQYLHQQNGGPASARNLGVRHAKGQIIFFTDDDCIVPRRWVETYLKKYCQYPEIVGVGGWMVTAKKSRSLFSDYLFVKNFLVYPLLPSLYLRDHEIISNNPLWSLSTFAYNTGNVSYKKSVFEEVGGFREEYKTPGREDNDLAFRIMYSGHPLHYIPLHVEEDKKLDLISFYRMQFKRGANFYKFIELNKKSLLEVYPWISKNYYTFSGLINWMFWHPHKIISLIHFLSYSSGITHEKLKESRSNWA